MCDHEHKSVRNPRTEIEWPIVWLLSALHRDLETKHINDDAVRLTRRSSQKTAHVYQAFTSRHVKPRVVQS